LRELKKLAEFYRRDIGAKPRAVGASRAFARG